jgi:hypothetical protein
MKSKDIPVQKVSQRMFQYKKQSVQKMQSVGNIPAQTIQSVGIIPAQKMQSKNIPMQKQISTENSVRRDIPVRNIRPKDIGGSKKNSQRIFHSKTSVIQVRNMQSVEKFQYRKFGQSQRIFQHKKIGQEEDSSTKHISNKKSISRDIPAQKFSQ